MPDPNYEFRDWAVRLARDLDVKSTPDEITHHFEVVWSNFSDCFNDKRQFYQAVAGEYQTTNPVREFARRLASLVKR